MYCSLHYSHNVNVEHFHVMSGAFDRNLKMRLRYIGGPHCKERYGNFHTCSELTFAAFKIIFREIISHKIIYLML